MKLLCKISMAVFLLFYSSSLFAQESMANRQSTVLFKKGAGNYDSYRIPAMVVTNKGTVLAFAEGRNNGTSDTGDIDTILRRSEDNGQTWSEPMLVWSDEKNTCGNPCPVVDEETGTIWLFNTHNLGIDHESRIIKETSKGTRTIWVSKSDDDGLTWSEPEDITLKVKAPNWTWYATGPGAGIQITSEKHKGRLVIPCDHIESGTRRYYSHIIYSDDHGKNWKLGGTTPQDKVNECEVVELSDGRLMLNMRNYDRKIKSRAISTSTDGGLTWSDLVRDDNLIEPICQASIRKYVADDKYMLLFSNPASKNGRVNMTVRLSYDDGKTWPVSKMLHEKASAYSCIQVLADGSIACFYEAGEKSAYESIVFDKFSLDWLTK